MPFTVDFQLINEAGGDLNQFLFACFIAQALVLFL